MLVDATKSTHCTFKIKFHKPSSCASRAAMRWQWLSESCSAEFSLVCSSAAFCCCTEASSCSWDSRDVAEARSSVRRTWWRNAEGEGDNKGGGWDELNVSAVVYSKVKKKPGQHRDSGTRQWRPGWVATGASRVTCGREVAGEWWLMEKKRQKGGKKE